MGDLDRELRRTLSALAEASPDRPELGHSSGRVLAEARSWWLPVLAAVVVVATAVVAILAVVVPGRDADPADEAGPTVTTTIPPPAPIVGVVVVVFEPGGVAEDDWDLVSEMAGSFSGSAHLVADDASSRTSALTTFADDPEALALIDEHPEIATGHGVVFFTTIHDAVRFQEDVTALPFVVAAIGSNGPRLGRGYGDALPDDAEDVRSRLWQALLIEWSRDLQPDDGSIATSTIDETFHSQVINGTIEFDIAEAVERLDPGCDTSGPWRAFISAGMPIEVNGPDGVLLGTSTLQLGELQGGLGCHFPFTIEVPDDAPTYDLCLVGMGPTGPAFTATDLAERGWEWVLSIPPDTALPTAAQPCTPQQTSLGDQPEVTGGTVSPSWVTVDDEWAGGILLRVIEDDDPPSPLPDSVVTMVLAHLDDGWTPYLYRNDLAGDLVLTEHFEVALGNADALSVDWHYQWSNTPVCDICLRNAERWDNGWDVWTDTSSNGMIVFQASHPTLPLVARIWFFADPITWPEAGPDAILRTTESEARQLTADILDSMVEVVPIPSAG